MKKTQKVVRIHPRKKPNLTMPVCPYCGRDAVMRPAEYVYGDDTITAGSMLYVCSGYPDCNSYVGVHRGTKNLWALWRIKNFVIKESARIVP